MPGALETAAIWFNHGGIHVGRTVSHKERPPAEVSHIQ